MLEESIEGKFEQRKGKIDKMLPEISEWVEGCQIFLNICVGILDLLLDDLIDHADLSVLLDTSSNNFGPEEMFDSFDTFFS